MIIYHGVAAEAVFKGETMLKNIMGIVAFCLGFTFAQLADEMKINLNMPIDIKDTAEINYVPESITKALDNMRVQPRQKHIILRHNYFDIIERYLETDTLDHYWYWNYKLIINF